MQHPSTKMEKEVRRNLRRIRSGYFKGSFDDLMAYLEYKLDPRRYRVGARKFRMELMRFLDKLLEMGKLVKRGGGYKVNFNPSRSSKQLANPRRRQPRSKPRPAAVLQY